MPIYSKLILANQPYLLYQYRQLPGANLKLDAEGERGGYYYIEMSKYVSASGSDYDYGDQLRAAQIYFQKFRGQCIFMPNDFSHKLESFQFNNLIKQVNPHFIQWLKYMAQETKTKIEFSFFYERGDTPYEGAYWLFNYEKNASVIESLEITDYDRHPRISYSILEMQNGELLYL